MVLALSPIARQAQRVRSMVVEELRNTADFYDLEKENSEAFTEGLVRARRINVKRQRNGRLIH